MIQLLAKPVIEKIHQQVSKRARAFAQKNGRIPRLAVVLVGQNPASVIYTSKKGEAAQAVGMEHETISLPETVSPSELKAVIHQLNENPRIDGILIQRPLPPQFLEEEVLFWISPEKDVDAFHPTNTGKLILGLPCFKPCTPAGIMTILDHYQINPSGKIACVIGRSSIVGKPMAALLLQANATVIHTHSRTSNLPQLARQADIVVAAIGRPHAIDASFIKEGAVVIDVGINRLPSGKVVGDVLYDEVSRVASAITPVPGGVGPMTIATLLENTVWAAEQRGY